MSQAIEVFATIRPDLKSFPRDAERGILPSMKSIGKAAGLALAAGVAVAGTAIAATAVKSIQAFSGFEKQMNEVFTLLPGISKTAMDKMSDQALKLAKDMGTLPEEIVPALYQALSAGVPQDNVFEFLETANKAAIGGITDIETSVNAITGVVNAYGSDVISATEASDLMFTTVRLGKTTFGELAASLSNVLPFAAAANVNFENISAAMSTLTSVTGRTAESTTALRQLVVELADSGKGVGETFEKVAGKSFKEFMDEGGNMQGALDLLAEHAGDTGLSIDQLFSSVEAGGAALILTGAASDAFAAALEEMGTSAGATEAAYAQMDQGLSRAMDRLKAGWEVIKIQIGENLAPIVQQFADWVVANMPTIETAIGEAMVAIEVWIRETAIPAFEDLLGWWEENGEEVKGWFNAIAASFGLTTRSIEEDSSTIREEFAAVGVSVEGSKSRMEAQFAALGVTVDEETSTMLEDFERFDAAFARHMDSAMAKASEWGAAWHGVMLWNAEVIATGLVKFYEWKAGLAKVNADVAEDFRNLGTSISNTWTNTLQWFSDGIDMFRDEFVRWGRNIRTTVNNVVRWFADGIEMFRTEIAGWIENVREAASKVGRFFSNLKTRVSTAMGNMLSAVRTKGGEIVGFFRGLPGRIARAMGNLAKTLYEKGKAIIGGFVQGIKDAIPGIGDAVGAAASAARSSAGTSSRGAGGGGRAMAKAQLAMAGLPLRFSSTYRTPAQNRAAGGAKNSLHMDRANPAVDIVGPTWALDAVAARLAKTPHRELLWRVPNHAPGDNEHVHYAHMGGMVSANWPTLPGLKSDERPVIAQIGEKITPKGRGGDGAQVPITVLLNIDGQRFATATAPAMRNELRHLEVTYS